MKVLNQRGSLATVFTKLATAAAVAAIAAIGLSGCGKNSSQSTVSSVRILNIAPEAGAISISAFINGATTATNFQSGIAYKATSGYTDITSGAQSFQISNAGGVITTTPTAFSLSVVSQQKQLLVVFGGATTTSAAFLNNDQSNVASTNARVRVANYMVGLGTFDVYVVGSAVDYNTVSPTIATGTGIYDVAIGSYQVILTSPGTKDIVLRVPARQLDAQQVYNLGLFNAGSGELPSAFWLKQNDDTGTPEFINSTISRIRSVNSQSTVASTNVNVNGALLFTNVTYGTASNFEKTSSGAKTIVYSDAGNPPSTNTYTLNTTFDGATDYSTFLSINPADNSISAFSISDKIFPPKGTNIRVRLVNATTIPNLALSIGNKPLTGLTATRAASAYFETTGGLGTTVSVSRDTAATAVISDTKDLTGGGSYSIIVSGTLANPAILTKLDK